jgi:hypothetical protein
MSSSSINTADWCWHVRALIEATYYMRPAGDEGEAADAGDGPDVEPDQAAAAAAAAAAGDPPDNSGAEQAATGRSLNLMSMEGGLSACELMLLAGHLPKHAYSEVQLPVRYSTGLRGAMASAVGMVLLTHAMRGCPALRRLRIKFTLSAQEVSQEIRQDVVPGPVALAFRRVFQVCRCLLSCFEYALCVLCQQCRLQSRRYMASTMLAVSMSMLILATY